MLNLRIIFIILLFFVATNSVSTKNEDRPKRQLWDFFTPNSKLYKVFNSDNPDDTLVQKFLESGSQPIYMYPLGSFNIYFPLTQDDEDYSDYDHTDYAEEDKSIYETMVGPSDEPYEAIVVENEELKNLESYLQYKVHRPSSELSKRGAVNTEDVLIEKNTLEKLDDEEDTSNNNIGKNINDLSNVITHKTNNKTNNNDENPGIKENSIAEKLNTTEVTDNMTVTTNQDKTDSVKLYESSILSNISSIPLVPVSDENCVEKTNLNITLPMQEAGEGNNTNDIGKNETITKGCSNVEDAKKNMTLFVSNIILQNVTEQNKNDTETDTSTNTGNVTYDEMFNEFLANFNQSASSTKQVASNNSNLKLNNNRQQINQNNVKGGNSNSVWPSLFIEKMISFFVRQSLVGRTDQVAVYHSSRRNSQANPKISQNKNNNRDYWGNVDGIRGDIGIAGFL